ncbi:hypothetical protein ACFLVB_03150 [Chloroflexota bacterium]
MEIMNGQAVVILKWVGLVFVAGFIGYFGRYLSMLIIEKVRRKRSGPETTAEPVKVIPVIKDTAIDEKKLKLEKKRAKSEAKKAKKTSQGK